MKFYTLIGIMLFSLLAISCGESTKERQEREKAEKQRVEDSIAQVAASQAEMERHKLDSIASAQKRAERLAEDSTLRAQLLPAFSEEKNSDSSGASMYKIKSAPKGHLQNYAYLSFTVDNGKAREMFINVCYTGTDWLNIESCSLLIDNDDAINLATKEVSNEVKELNCCEWFSTILDSGIIDKLLDAKSIKVKLIGDEGSKEISLNPKQIDDAQKTIKLFNAFGG